MQKELQTCTETQVWYSVIMVQHSSLFKKGQQKIRRYDVFIYYQIKPMSKLKLKSANKDWKMFFKKRKKKLFKIVL